MSSSLSAWPSGFSVLEYVTARELQLAVAYATMWASTPAGLTALSEAAAAAELVATPPRQQQQYPSLGLKSDPLHLLPYGQYRRVLEALLESEEKFHKMKFDPSSQERDVEPQQGAGSLQVLQEVFGFTLGSALHREWVVQPQQHMAKTVARLTHALEILLLCPYCCTHTDGSDASGIALSDFDIHIQWIAQEMPGKDTTAPSTSSSRRSAATSRSRLAATVTIRYIPQLKEREAALRFGEISLLSARVKGETLESSLRFWEEMRESHSNPSNTTSRFDETTNVAAASSDASTTSAEWKALLREVESIPVVQPPLTRRVPQELLRWNAYASFSDSETEDIPFMNDPPTTTPHPNVGRTNRRREKFVRVPVVTSLPAECEMVYVPSRHQTKEVKCEAIPVVEGDGLSILSTPTSDEESTPGSPSPDHLHVMATEMWERAMTASNQRAVLERKATAAPRSSSSSLSSWKRSRDGKTTSVSSMNRGLRRVACTLLPPDHQPPQASDNDETIHFSDATRSTDVMKGQSGPSATSKLTKNTTPSLLTIPPVLGSWRSVAAVHQRQFHPPPQFQEPTSTNYSDGVRALSGLSPSAQEKVLLQRQRLWEFTVWRQSSQYTNAAFAQENAGWSEPNPSAKRSPGTPHDIPHPPRRTATTTWGGGESPVWAQPEHLLLPTAKAIQLAFRGGDSSSSSPRRAARDPSAPSHSRTPKCWRWSDGLSSDPPPSPLSRCGLVAHLTITMDGMAYVGYPPAPEAECSEVYPAAPPLTDRESAVGVRAEEDHPPQRKDVEWGAGRRSTNATLPVAMNCRLRLEEDSGFTRRLLGVS